MRTRPLRPGPEAFKRTKNRSRRKLWAKRRKFSSQYYCSELCSFAMQVFFQNFSEKNSISTCFEVNLVSRRLSRVWKNFFGNTNWSVLLKHLQRISFHASPTQEPAACFQRMYGRSLPLPKRESNLVRLLIIDFSLFVYLCLILVCVFMTVFIVCWWLILVCSFNEYGWNLCWNHLQGTQCRPCRVVSSCCCCGFTIIFSAGSKSLRQFLPIFCVIFPWSELFISRQ